MRINKTDKAYQIYKNNNVGKNARLDKGIKETDKLEISSKAMEFQYAMKKLKNVDEMRMEKVEGIKKQIESGTYEIDGKKIADKIMKSIEFDKKI